MIDRTSTIFGNPIDQKTVQKAEKSKAKYLKKYGDDSEKDYPLNFKPIETLDFLGASDIVVGEENRAFSPNALIVGNIRMGFGHYRISIAMASCARALGYDPYWLDLASFDATGSAMIREQNAMYSMASRLSQKSHLFNHFVWEPLNSEGFKKITYNAKDQKNSELLTPLFRHIPKDIPYIATHVWPSQAAVHAGLTHVVNAIPDNWPMGLHLSEGAIHTVQTPFAYLGYKTLNGFAKSPLQGIPEDQMKMVGCYVDHELLVNLEADNELRRARMRDGKPIRILMTVGGAGAGFDMFLSMVKHLLPLVEAKKVMLVINFGDHLSVYEKMIEKLGNLQCQTFFNQYGDLKSYVSSIREADASGIVAICNEDIFQAVYSTNLLMPVCDLMVTKPSELAYYPIPKVFMRHIGGHEVWGATWGSQTGDATMECADVKSVNAMLDRLISDREILAHFCDRIDKLKAKGFYNGAYECVRLAVGERKA